MPYSPGLDGLRAFAVIAVLLYHGQDLEGIPGWLEPRGGFLGVEVFFVISGYLITALLAAEYDRSGSIELRRFWARRMRRLFPALGLFIAGTVALAALFASDTTERLRDELFGAVFHVSNWVLISADESYFDAAARPSLFRHLWSLAIEGQFYLLWPVALAGLLRRFSPRETGALLAVAAVAATALLWSLFDRVAPYGDVSGVYFRTDARAGALFVGAALGLLWRPWTRTSDASPISRSLQPVAAAALVALAALNYLFTDRVVQWDRITSLYHGGFLLVSLLTAVVIAAVVVPHSQAGRLLGNPLLRWIGTRSYAIYLWHWPIFQLTRPDVDVRLDGWKLLIVRWVLTVALSEASYRLIEVPVRRRYFLAVLRTSLPTPRGILLGTIGSLGLILAVAGVAFALPDVDHGVAAATEDAFGGPLGEGTPALGVAQPAVSPTAAANVSMPQPTSTPAAPPTPAPIAPIQRSISPAPALPIEALVLPTPTQVAQPTPAPLAAGLDAETSRIYLFGDSVILGAQSQLSGIGAAAAVDGRIGRQWWEAPGELRDARTRGLTGDVVVVQLGNNGSFNAPMFDAVMAELGAARVVLFVNVRAPVPWEAEVNAALAHHVGRYPAQVRLVDWYHASNEHPEYFIEDATHLSGAGQTAFRRLIESTLAALS